MEHLKIIKFVCLFDGLLCQLIKVKVYTISNGTSFGDRILSVIFGSFRRSKGDDVCL